MTVQCCFKLKTFVTSSVCPIIAVISSPLLASQMHALQSLLAVANRRPTKSKQTSRTYIEHEQMIITILKLTLFSVLNVITSSV